jgi:hypothetical protein
VAPYRRVNNVAPQQTWNRGRGTEEDAFTTVVTASETRRASVAWDTRLDRDSVARFQMCYGWMDGDDLAQIGAVDRFKVWANIPLQQTHDRGHVYLQRSSVQYVQRARSGHLNYKTAQSCWNTSHVRYSYIPADPRTSNLYYHLALSKVCSGLNICDRWISLIEPQIVLWIGVYTDVRPKIQKRSHCVG